MAIEKHYSDVSIRGNSNTHSHSRLNTHDSKGSHHYRLNRSPSPTDFWKRDRTRKDHIHEKVHELNVFIHKGIEKFLDKQAVRDLIIEYDAEDIYIGGEDMFLANVNEETDGLNFSRSEKRRQADVGVASFTIGGPPGSTNLGIPGNGNSTSKAAIPGAGAGVTSRQKKKAGRKAGSPWAKPKSGLWNSFFSAIRIKLFNVHHRQKSAMRRRIDSQDIFRDHP